MMRELVIGAPYRTLPSDARRVFDGEIFEVWQWEQELYDGSMATFERIKRVDAATMLGVLPGGNVLLARDEQPDRGAVLTLPGGRIEAGEKPEEAARREFLEETGYAVKTLVPLYWYSPSSKIDWKVHVFAGRDVEKVAEAQPDSGEKISVEEFTFDEFLELGHDWQLRDVVLRLLLLEAKLDEDKRAELQKLLYG